VNSSYSQFIFKRKKAKRLR